MVKTLEDMRDVTQHGPEGTEVKLKCVKEPVEEPIVSIECDTDWSTSGGVEDVRSSYIEKVTRERSARNISVDKWLTVPALETDEKKQWLKQRRAKIGEACKLVLPRWRKQMAKAGLLSSRSQLLCALVPASGGTKVKDRMLQSAA